MFVFNNLNWNYLSKYDFWLFLESSIESEIFMLLLFILSRNKTMPISHCCFRSRAFFFDKLSKEKKRKNRRWNLWRTFHFHLSFSRLSNNMAGLCTKILLILVAFLIPPVAVWIARDKICSGTVLINVLLWILGVVS